MLQQFRHLYPQGSIVSELINIDRGLYIVKVVVQNQEVIFGTGLAAAETVEKAEDRARERALMTINLQAVAHNSQIKQSPPTIPQIQTTAIESPKPEESYSSSSTNKAPQATVTSNQVFHSQPIPESEEQNNFAVSTIPQENTSEVISHTTPQEEPQINIFDQPITPPPEETTSTESETAKIEETVELDFNVIKHKTDLEMKRLNWTKEQGRDYLLSTYGKRSRLHLTDEELIEFWRYLETLPN